MTRWRRDHQKPQPLPTILRPYRAEGVSFGVALLSGQPDSLRLISAIQLRGLPRWKRPREPMPTDHRARWEWLWSGYNGGPTDPTFLRVLAPIARLSPEAARLLWGPVRMSRLVMPGGRGAVNRPALRRLLQLQSRHGTHRVSQLLGASDHEHDSEDDEDSHG